MKKSVLIPILLLSLSLCIGQSTPYREAMFFNLEKLDSAKNQGDYINCANQFERIGLAEKGRWLPFYYGAYSLILPSFDEQDGTRHDQLLDRAQQLIDQGLRIAPDESELHVLQAFLYPSRIIVDPMARGMEYLQKCNQSLETAKKLNPDNPRIYFLEGVNILNLPEGLGGGREKALPILLKAREKYALSRNNDLLWPHWGGDQVEATLETIQK